MEVVQVPAARVVVVEVAAAAIHSPQMAVLAVGSIYLVLGQTAPAALLERPVLVAVGVLAGHRV